MSPAEREAAGRSGEDGRHLKVPIAALSKVVAGFEFEPAAHTQGRRCSPTMGRVPRTTLRGRQ